MSRERDELLRLARDAKCAAGAHLQRLSEGAARTSTSIARRHPWLVAGGAVALGALFTTIAHVGSPRRGRAGRGERARRRSWPIGLGALALRLLPTVLRVGSVGADTAGACASNGAGRSDRAPHDR